MAKASDNLFPSILLDETTAPDAPVAGTQRLFIDSADGILKAIDDAGVVREVEGTSGVGTAGPRPLSLPQGTLERKYDFASDVTGWTASAGTLAHDATNGRLKHTAGATGSTMVILEPSSAASVADGELVADFSEESLSSGSVDSGVFFRATDANNLYMLAIAMQRSATKHVELFKRVSGTYTSLGAGSQDSNAMPVRWPTVDRLDHRIMVRFTGGHIRAYLNEVFIGAWNDTTFTTGRVGVRHLANASASQVAYWDNVSVYSLASGWRPPAYD